MTKVKICGITDEQSLEASIKYGATFIGLVFYPKSPRFLTLEQVKTLNKKISGRIRAVSLFVNPKDEELESILGSVHIDMIQLHGDEPPERVTQIKQKFSKPVMKAIKIGDIKDIEIVHIYEPVADWILLDAKAPNAKLPGGNGIPFDWNLLKNFTCKKPWMLAGGLDEKNVHQAIKTLLPHNLPDCIDISSGVEHTPGKKDVQKIKNLLQTVNTYNQNHRNNH